MLIPTRVIRKMGISRKDDVETDGLVLQYKALVSEKTRMWS